MREADIIIPVYKPDQRLMQMLEQLEKQTQAVHRIILMNTGREYFEQMLEKMRISENMQNRQALEHFEEMVRRGIVLVKHITKKEFDHGRTRNAAVLLSDSPFFVMMTDDAIPADDMLIEKLLAPFAQDNVAVTYARQLPAKNCGVLECFTREFNYPKESKIKTADDLPTMGIKAFFASNACAAYRREVFDRLGGFTAHTIFNEDMIYARGVLNAGLGIAYAADACVLHSHNYTGVEQFKRNFDLGVSHASNPEVFSNLATESEGIRLVKKTCRYLVHIGKPWLILKLIWQSGCKYAGYFLGKNYRRLPGSILPALSMNRDYWNTDNRKV